ncbi:MAG: hypothetical protein OXT07_13875 [bacterium]|nr:hypothetical protein [bacterium]MDE0217533.1 hypothetical protein [bacterium]
MPTQIEPGFYREQEQPRIEKDVRHGIVQWYQGFNDWDNGISTRIGTATLKPGYFAPRHCHTFAQFRYAIGGAITYAGVRIEEGECVYVPEGALYGEAQVDPDGDGHYWADMQFSGPSGIRYCSPPEMEAARREIEDFGTVDSYAGTFTYSDDNRTVDVMDALYAHLMDGAVPDFPEPRYHQMIHIRPAEFRPRAALAGHEAAVKDLLQVTEVGPRVMEIAMDSGGFVDGGQQSFQQAFWLLEGAIEMAGERYDGVSFGYFPADKPFPRFTALEDARLITLHWSPVHGPSLTPSHV